MAVLRTSASAGADGPVVVLSGEADTTTAALLREILTTQLETGARLVTVDASGLSFLDSASLRVLVLAARALQGRHGTLVFARPQPLVARILEITGADKLLDVRDESLAVLGAGESELGGGIAGDRDRVGGGRNESAAGIAVPAGDGAFGGVHPDGLTRGGAGRPDALQGPVQHRVVRVELAAQRQRQIPGTDVEAVDAVDGQGGVEVGDRVGRLGHDETERLRRSQHPARGAVPGGRVADGTGDLASLDGRVDVGHDDALAAQVECPPDIGGVRMPDPADGRRPREPERAGQRGQVSFGGPAVLQVDHHVVQARGGQQPRGQRRRDHRPGAVQSLTGDEPGTEGSGRWHRASEPYPLARAPQCDETGFSPRQESPADSTRRGCLPSTYPTNGG
jgi:anti-sigma B factor antagonist